MSLGDAQRAFHRQPLDLDTVVLDLDEVPVAKDLLKPAAISIGSAKSSSDVMPPLSSVRLNSPDTQPLRQIIPSLCAASSSLSIRGLK